MGREIELRVSCDDCVRRGTPDCSDCLVSFVFGEVPEELELTSQESEIVQLLSREGMLPRLRFHSSGHEH